MSHRSRWTHELRAERDEQVGEDDYESPVYDTVALFAGEDYGSAYGEDYGGRVEIAPDGYIPVRFRPAGTEYVRGETGERVRRAPTIVGQARLADALEEGDVVSLTPLDPAAETIDDVEIVGIERQYGRGARSAGAVVELEGI